MGFNSTESASAEVCAAELPILDLSRYPGATVQTVDQAAVDAHVSRAQLYRYVRAGLIQAWRDPATGHLRLIREITRTQLKGIKK